MSKEVEVKKGGGLPKEVMLLLGLCAALVLAVLVGGIVHLVGRLIYLILLFPIGMGGIGFIINSVLIKQSKNRNLILGILCGLVIGLTIYGSYHFFDYLQFRSELVNEWMASDNVSDPVFIGEYEEYFDFLLQEETGQSGFFGYLVFTAQEGIEIGRAVGSGGGTNIGDVGTYIYYIIEIIIVMGAAAAAGFLVGDNYCENCDKWYDEQLTAELPLDTQDAAMAALESGNFSELMELLNPQDDVPYLKITTDSCASCNSAPSEVELLICTAGKNDSVDEDTLFKKQYDAHETKALRVRLKNLV